MEWLVRSIAEDFIFEAANLQIELARLAVPHSHTQSPSYTQSTEHDEIRGVLASNSKIHISTPLVFNYTSYSSVYFGLELALYTLEVASLHCFLLSAAMVRS